jgi:hypothetical protein
MAGQHFAAEQLSVQKQDVFGDHPQTRLGKSLILTGVIHEFFKLTGKRDKLTSMPIVIYWEFRSQESELMKI